MSEKITKLPAASLVFDFTLYPRTRIDSQHVGYIADAIRGGATMPPIIICAKTKRIADGFHRASAFKRINEKAVINVIERHYKTGGDLFIDAVRMNAAHGRALTRCDRARVSICCRELHIKPNVLAEILHTSLKDFNDLLVNRTAYTSGTKIEPRGLVPLKRTIQHMAGRRLTEAQGKANDSLSGMNQLFYVNQMIAIIENGLLEPDNEDLLRRLDRLAELIDGLKVK